MNTNGLEIEHKYLIEYPDRDELLAMEGVKTAVIEQTYLESEKGSTERVRRWEEDGEVIYYHTVKRRVSDLTHTEDEIEITDDEYQELLKRKRGGCSPVCKERIMIPYDGHTVEVDIYPFWQADPAVWPQHAPVLFPVCGSVRDGRILIDGTAYPMTKHGFTREPDFAVAAQGADYVDLVLTDSEQDRKSVV